MESERETAIKIQESLEKQARRAKVKWLLKTAVKYGVVKMGWTAADYMRDAVENFGWESTGITGIKGSAKSNLLLQRGFAIYGNWDDVFEHTVTVRDQFMDLLEDAIEKDERIPWLGVDDIATIFPRSLYFTDRKLYSELKSSWETLRTVMSNFDWTATRKNKVATFITDDLTGDIIAYNRRKDIKAFYDYRRWLWLRNPKDPNEMIAKLIAIEDIPFPLTPDSFKIDKALLTGQYHVCGEVYEGKIFFEQKARLGGVPRGEFRKYWNNRLMLASNSYHKFKQIIEDGKRKEERKRHGPTKQEWGRYSQYRKKLAEGKQLTIEQMQDYYQINEKIYKTR